MKQTTERGFVILIAVVVASILISIGVGIANFTYRELILASTARNSMYAFYAADSGIECALYWDNIFLANRGTNPTEPSAFVIPPAPVEGEDPPVQPADSIECNGYVITLNPCTTFEDVDNVNCREASGLTRFGFSMGDNDEIPTTPFARVIVDKTQIHAAQPSTRIDSSGVNVNQLDSVRKVERGLFTTY